MSIYITSYFCFEFLRTTLQYYSLFDNSYEFHRSKLSFLLFVLNQQSSKVRNYYQLSCPIIYDIILHPYQLDSDNIKIMASSTQLHTCPCCQTGHFLSKRALSVHITLIHATIFRYGHSLQTINDTIAK